MIAAAAIVPRVSFTALLQDARTENVVLRLDNDKLAAEAKHLRAELDTLTKINRALKERLQAELQAAWKQRDEALADVERLKERILRMGCSSERGVVE